MAPSHPVAETCMEFLNFHPQISHLKRRFLLLELFRQSRSAANQILGNNCFEPQQDNVIVLQHYYPPPKRPPSPLPPCLHPSLGSNMFLLAYFGVTWVCFLPF